MIDNVVKSVIMYFPLFSQISENNTRHTEQKYKPRLQLCFSQAQTLAQTQAITSPLFCDAPRVVAAKIDRDRQQPTRLFDTFLLNSNLALLLENNPASPQIVDIIIFEREILKLSGKELGKNTTQARMSKQKARCQSDSE